MAINKTCMVKMNLIFKDNELLRSLHTENITQKVYPEDLAFALLISFAFPEIGKFLCCFSLIYIFHRASCIVFVSSLFISWQKEILYQFLEENVISVTFAFFDYNK